jgi:HPt (histidine-containing phosphotransfer) domain-containing protein
MTSSLNSSIFDIDRLNLVAGTQEEKRTVIKLFFELLREYLKQMQEALAEGNQVAFAAAAHALKGSAANLGMQGLARLCQHAQHVSPVDQQAILGSIYQEISAIERYLISKELHDKAVIDAS